jgi:DNA-binding transcriptional ArsR family regulator
MPYTVLKELKKFLNPKINRNIAIHFKDMGATKSGEFSVKDNTIAKIAKALSHPARVAILKILIKRQACICGDIVDELPLSQSTISQHLKELKGAGLIKGEIEGVTICYCIDEKQWKAAQVLLNDIFSSYEKVGNECC